MSRPPSCTQSCSHVLIPSYSIPTAEEIQITYSYWDGSGHRRNVKVIYGRYGRGGGGGRGGMERREGAERVERREERSGEGGVEGLILSILMLDSRRYLVPR